MATRSKPSKAQAATPKTEEPQIVRPNDLAKELGVDGKRVRAFLRQEYTRASDAKNTNWALTPEMVEAVKERFTPKAEDSDES